MDDLWALDGGAAARKWQSGRTKRKAKEKLRRQRQREQEARDRRREARLRRRKLRKKIEKEERSAFLKRRRADGYRNSKLPYKDITGKRYGRLVVIGPAGHNRSGSKRWWVQCDCGMINEVAGTNMKQGILRSCGCLLKDVAKRNGEKRKAARLRKANLPISRQMMQWRRKQTLDKEAASMLRRARNLVVWAEVQLGIIKRRNCWRSDRYRPAGLTRRAL